MFKFLASWVKWQMWSWKCLSWHLWCWVYGWCERVSPPSIFRVVSVDRLRFHSFCISYIYTYLSESQTTYYIIGYIATFLTGPNINSNRLLLDFLNINTVASSLNPSDSNRISRIFILKWRWKLYFPLNHLFISESFIYILKNIMTLQK